MTDETAQQPADETTGALEASEVVAAVEEAPEVAEVVETPVAEATPDAPAEAPAEAPASEAAETPTEETAAEPAAESPGEEVPYTGRSREEILTDVEAIAATPDETDGRQPDDRPLQDRLKVLDAEWQGAPEPAEGDKDLRRRYDTARKTYAAARARRAELRAVTRARAGETKRGLLVEAFALARMVDPEKVAVPTPTPVPAAKAAPARPARTLNRPTPAMFARKAPAEGAAEAPAESTDASVETEATDPTVLAAEAVDGVETAAAPETPEAADVVETPESVETPEAPAPEDVVEALTATETPEAPAETPEAIGTVEATEVVDAVEIAEVAAGSAEVTETAEVAEVEATEAPADEAPAATEESPAEEAAPETPAIDLAHITTQATRLQEEWRAAGFAGKQTEDELSPLFRTYLDVVFSAARKVSGAKISARKDLVREARALATRAGEAAAAEMTGLTREAKALQERWKTGEAAPRGPENTAWKQFSGALREVFENREKHQAGATAEREEIVASISALQTARDPFRAVRDVGPLLKRWGSAGPVPGKVYAELKAKLDKDLAAIRARADAERKRRDAEDDKSQAERAKHASKLVKEAERGRQRSGGSGGGRDRGASSGGGGGGDSALAAAFAAAFGKTDTVAKEVADLEATVADLEARLAAAERPDADVVRSETGQGFTVSVQVDRSAYDPAKLAQQLEVARAALTRRKADLDAMQSTAGTLGLR